MGEGCEDSLIVLLFAYLFVYAVALSRPRRSSEERKN